ncbi:MAG: insulinase family protein [Deltaproteobacteria bacterium]|nr:insulinase family protein [Candidatus Anaeroferrophillus wilburensis]MBN2889250.1 insulinase family protein [Deltaproteobacteria bacterium]
MTTSLVTPGQSLHGFTVERLESIEELRCQAAVLTHQETGARLVHLINDDPNNLFCIGFRTPVYDNTGVPHILEHSVLSGSRKFPLKDPFKELLKGSLQTFLNAMTYPDKTLYPVSSQVEADFYNLVDVYCDAVFHPLLTRETFYQEGWHFDLPDAADPVSIKGIVYNEMKGVFSDFHSHVTRKTMGELFPDTTYYYESGGEPEHITDLTYEQFVAFHQQYYHPSNAFIFLYGNLPTEKTLAFLQQQYLVDFRRREVDADIKPQPRWQQPREITIEAPASKEDDGTASVILAWLLEPATNPFAGLLGHILSRYLVGTQSSPLRRALIDSGLGEDLDDMTGFEGELAQTFFAVGLRKTKPEQVTAIRRLVTTTLEREIASGMNADLLEGAIRRIEFRLREITDSGHYPYNLMLADRCYRSWIYGGDPLAHLRFAEPLQRIKAEKAKGTDFFTNQLRTMFLENPHHLISVVTASAAMGEQLGGQTARQAAELSKDFGEDEKQHYHELTGKLLARQMTPPTADELATLPKLDKVDLPTKNQLVPTETVPLAGARWYRHPLFTAGIIYLDMGFDLAGLPAALLPYLPLYTELISRCGAAGYSYEEMSTRISLNTGGISCSDICLTDRENPDELIFKAFFHGKSLPERFGELLAIFQDLFLEPQLDNPKLIKDILLEMRNDLQAAIPRSGHQYAISHAAARLSTSLAIEEQLNGIAQLRFLDQLLQSAELEAIGSVMNKLHQQVINRRGCILSTTYEHPDFCTTQLEALLQALPGTDTNPAAHTLSSGNQAAIQGIEISSSVNYVAQSWKVSGRSAEDLGQFHLLSRNLSTGLLWDKIRVEGGAYGGMAMASGSHPLFSCASYRDPNLSRTLSTFSDSLATLAAGTPVVEVNQSIIGTIGRIDAPKSPHAKGFGETIALFSGRTTAFRQQVRESVLAGTPASLAAKARQLLDEPRKAVTVLGSAAAFDQAAKEGLKISRQPLLPKEEVKIA